MHHYFTYYREKNVLHASYYMVTQEPPQLEYYCYAYGNIS